MSDAIKSLLAWLSLLVYLAFAVVVAGLQTNWFRYSASLEALPVLLPLAISTILVVVFNSLFLFTPQKRKAANLLIGLLSAGLGVLLTIWMSKVSQGVYFPEWYTNDVASNGPQKLKTAAGELSYFLELHNPFASSHQEFLVIQRLGTRKVVSLPLFPPNQPRHGFVSSNNPSDWCVLMPTNDPDVYLLHVSSFLRESIFEVNLRELSARELSTPTSKQNTWCDVCDFLGHEAVNQGHGSFRRSKPATKKWKFDQPFLIYRLIITKKDP